MLINEFDVEMSVYRLTPELHVGWHIGDTGLTPYIGVDYTWLRANTDWTSGQPSQLARLIIT